MHNCIHLVLPLRRIVVGDLSPGMIYVSPPASNQRYLWTNEISFWNYEKSNRYKKKSLISDTKPFWNDKRSFFSDTNSLRPETGSYFSGANSLRADIRSFICYGNSLLAEMSSFKPVMKSISSRAKIFLGLLVTHFLRCKSFLDLKVILCSLWKFLWDSAEIPIGTIC